MSIKKLIGLMCLVPFTLFMLGCLTPMIYLSFDELLSFVYDVGIAIFIAISTIIGLVLLIDKK